MTLNGVKRNNRKKRRSNSSRILLFILKKLIFKKRQSNQEFAPDWLAIKQTSFHQKLKKPIDINCTLIFRQVQFHEQKNCV